SKNSAEDSGAGVPFAPSSEPHMPALPVGTPAPDFLFSDSNERHRISEFRGIPVILAFAPTGHDLHQPVLQHVMFEGERLTVVSPCDETVAERYGVTDRFALFVIGGSGAVAWRHTA